MSGLTLARYILFAALVLFSLATLGLSAHLLSTVRTDLGFVPAVYVQLDIAVAILTLVVLVPVLAVNLFRKGAFTSMVAVELAWSFFLMVLWIAAAGQTTAERANVSCIVFDGFGNSFVDTTCHEAQALIAFSWVCFIILIGWLVTLSVFAVTGYQRGNIRVWTASVTETDFNKRYGPPIPSTLDPGNPYATQQTQQAYPAYGVGYPPTGYGAPEQQQQQQQQPLYPQTQQFSQGPPGAVQV